MKKINLIALLVLQTLLFSCKKDAELVTPEKKIVINAQISPTDDTIRVILTYSRPVNSVNPSLININGSYDPENEFEGTTVILSSGTSFAILKRDRSSGWFELAQNDFKLTEGAVYTLYVKDASGREVTANTTIPFPVTGITYDVLNEQQVVSTNSASATRYDARFRFTDKQNSLHYYRLYSGLTTTRNTNEIVFGNFLQDDEPFFENGEVIVKSTIRNLLIPGDIVVNRYGYFISCSEEYFQYYKSLENINGTSNEPELLEEPVNIYSNVSGGLGIFAGYNLVKVIK